MFEKASSIQNAQAGQAAMVAVGPTLPGAMVDARAGEALRAIGWSELAARINAARDLREVLRSDSAQGALTVASFGDAAGSYFAAASDCERPVNPIALEARKASTAMPIRADGEAAKGDREN
ncbi:MAG: hypothetical protein ABJP48_05405 [Erythrobacter sp.]